MHQDIYVVRSSKVKTRSGRFDSSEIGCRIVFHAGRSWLDVQFRGFDTFRAQYAHQKRLCQSQLSDADENEQKDDRHRSMHAR